MSVFPPVPWLVRYLIGKGLRAEDQPPPPAGFDSWAAYLAYERIDPLADYLPLGEPAPEGSKLSAIWTRTGEDVATIGLHFVHVAIGTDTTAFTDTERAAIEARFNTLWGSLKDHYNADYQLDRYEWHDFGVDIRRPNPRSRETLLTPVPGTDVSSVPLPPQVAVSITFKTSVRKQWGRVYMPTPESDYSEAPGVLTHAAVDDYRTAFGTFADGVASDSTPLVVWSPRHDGNLLKYGAANHAANLDVPDTSSFARSVLQIQVDNLFDVIRSRRFDKATYKATHTIT